MTDWMRGLGESMWMLSAYTDEVLVKMWDVGDTTTCPQ